MSITSINNNIAAYAAQRSVGHATSDTQSSIARLSSGNRIVRASDDVSATATGTALRGSVTILRQALLNTSQGASLLQIADGALSQVTDILTRQKTLAMQAGSGSVSNADRAFIDQEFQALALEIDRIAKSTKFGSVTLLDGSLSGAEALANNTQVGTNVSATTAGDVFQITGALTNASSVTVNGLVISFTDAAVGSRDAAGKVVIGASPVETAANLVRFMNESADPRLANLHFVATGANITANWGGGALDGPYILEAGTGDANITAGTSADMTIAAGVSGDGLSVDRVRAVGSVSGTLFANGGTTADLAGPAIITSTIEDNAHFIGKLGQGRMGLITGSYASATDTASFQLKVGDITYSALATDIVDPAVIPLVFTGTDDFGNAAGGSFTLNVGGGTVTTFDSQGQLDSLVKQFNEAFSGVSFTQNRDILSFQEGASVQVNGTEIANLNGASVNFRSEDFTSVTIEDIHIAAPEVGSTDSKFTVQINGETYVSLSGMGNQIGINTSIVLQNVSNPSRVLTIQTGNTAIAGSTSSAIDLSSQDKADAVAAALKTAFGIDEGSAKLSFRVGNATSEILGVKIDSIATKHIYNGKTLSISTQENAAIAGNAIEAALNKVTAIRTGVGSLQSRFDFAAGNIELTVQNQDVARGMLLDTDVTSESTKYSTSQVQMQAGINVLAQANQLTNNLLKLLG